MSNTVSETALIKIKGTLRRKFNVYLNWRKKHQLITDRKITFHGNTVHVRTLWKLRRDLHVSTDESFAESKLHNWFEHCVVVDFVDHRNDILRKRNIRMIRITFTAKMRYIRTSLKIFWTKWLNKQFETIENVYVYQGCLFMTLYLAW